MRLGTDEVLKWLVANVWKGFALPFLSPIVSWIVGFVLSVLMVRLDWFAYMLLDDWQNTQEANDYKGAADALANLPNSATPAEVAAAQATKIAAFKRLISLGSPPHL